MAGWAGSALAVPSLADERAIGISPEIAHDKALMRHFATEEGRRKFGINPCNVSPTGLGA
jgi:hypothetical protein